MSRCLIILDSQPVTMDQYLAVKQVVTEFSKITLCIIDKPIVMSTNMVVRLWKMALSEYPEVRIVTTKIDFTSISSLPEELDDFDMVKVTDTRTYTHLTTIGIPIELLGHVNGYNQMFMRVAFRQGLALDYLKKFLIN